MLDDLNAFNVVATYWIYEYVDSMVKINTDSGIQLTERAARDHYNLHTFSSGILEYERAYLENGSLIRQYVRNCPVEHAEYYFLQKCIDKLEQLKFAPKGMHKLDEVVHDMRVRSNKFSGVSESDRQRYTELATRYPKIVQPSKDPYYEYDRRVIGNDLCANSKTVIWGGNRNTLL
ncbi:hypothetical protein M3Y97_00657400 [Aphelenchoides bicaudatus]|nr:hypothetical protein M3Y97_00657400 [Aphelenchoides bicaudatus]